MCKEIGRERELCEVGCLTSSAAPELTISAAISRCPTVMGENDPPNTATLGLCAAAPSAASPLSFVLAATVVVAIEVIASVVAAKLAVVTPVGAAKLGAVTAAAVTGTAATGADGSTPSPLSVAADAPPAQ
jgi:hypothetical protein